MSTLGPPDSCSTADYIRRISLKPHSYEQGLNSRAILPTHACTQAHLYGQRWWSAFSWSKRCLRLDRNRHNAGLPYRYPEWYQKYFQVVLENFLQLNVWLWFTVFTQRLSPQSGFGHPATTVHENAGSRHQRLFQDYSSQQHEITLWQIQLAWQDTMSLIRSHSVLNQIAYKCPKLNQAAPWNVASWLYWSLTQTGRHLAPRTDCPQ